MKKTARPERILVQDEQYYVRGTTWITAMQSLNGLYKNLVVSRATYVAPTDIYWYVRIAAGKVLFIPIHFAKFSLSFTHWER